MRQSVEILNVFWKTKTFFKKVKALRLKMHHFHTKLPCQKPMLRQIEWWVHNELITKNGVLPLTTLFFWKFYFSLSTSCKELIWYTSDPDVHISSFCKRWSFIWPVLFPCEYPSEIFGKLKMIGIYINVPYSISTHHLIKSTASQ